MEQGGTGKHQSKVRARWDGKISETSEQGGTWWNRKKNQKHWCKVGVEI